MMTSLTWRSVVSLGVLALACGPGIESLPGWSDKWAVCGQLGSPPPVGSAAGHGVFVVKGLDRFDVHDLPSGDLRLSIAHDATTIDPASASVSPDGSTLLALGGNGSIIARWSLLDGSRGNDAPVEPPAGWGSRVRWSPDGTRIAVVVPGIAPGGVTVRSMPAGALLATFPGVDVVLPDAETAVVWQADTQEVTRFRIADQQELGRSSIAAYGAAIGRVELSPDGTLVAIVSESTTNPLMNMVRTSDATLVWSTPGGFSGFSGDGRFFTTDDNYGGNLNARLSSDGTVVLEGIALDAPPDGSCVFSEVADQVTIFGPDLTASSSFIAYPSPGRPTAMEFSPDGALIATSTRNVIHLWKAPGQQLLWQRTVPGLAPSFDGGAITSLAFSPDGSQLVAAGPAAPGTLWRVADGTLRHSFNDVKAGETLYSLAFSYDGTLIIAGPAATPTIRRWRADDLAELKPIQTTRQNAAAIGGANEVRTSAPESWQLDPPSLLWRAPEDALPTACAEGGDWITREFVGRRCAGVIKRLNVTRIGVTLSDVPGQLLVQQAGITYSVERETGTYWAVRADTNLQKRVGTLPVHFMDLLAGSPRESMIAVSLFGQVGSWGAPRVALVYDRSRYDSASPSQTPFSEPLSLCGM